MQGTKLRGPIVACALLGVVCVSSIAYYFYNRRKKRSLLDRLKQAYTGDHGFFDNDDSLEQEESYDLPEPSEYSDYLIVQATNQDNQLTATSLDKGSKYDDFEEVAYIEDVSDEGRSNKGYKILANKAVSKSRPNAPNHTQEADRSNRSSDNTKKETSDEWTLIDDYTNIDGSAEELVYVESTNNTFSEEVDVQKDKSVPLACEEIVVSSENVDCCNSSCGTDECCHTNPLDNCNSENGLIEEALSTDPVDTKVPEDPIEEVPEQLVDNEVTEESVDTKVPEELVDDNEVPEEPVDTKVPEQLVDDNEVPEELVDDNEVPEEPVEEVPEELVDDNEVPEDESPEQLGDIEVPVEPVDEELPGEILDVDLFVEQVDGELLGEILGTNLLVEQVDVEVPEEQVDTKVPVEQVDNELVEEAPEEIVDNKVPAEPVVIKLAEEPVDEEAGEEAEVLSDNSMDQLYDASTPELTKIYFKNFGCSHNISDGEYMLGLLVEYGYKIVDTMEKSHLVIINSCTVKGPSEEAMVTMIKSAVMSYLPVVVSGCVPQADQSNPVFNNPLISLLGITQIDRIVEVVENSLQGNKMVLLEKKDLPRLDLPKIRRNKLIEIIPLSTGCLGSCTFCKTKHSRGVLGSYDIEIILDRVESCVNEGVKEIWLTSEDLGAYGIDIGTNLVTLLRSIVQVLPQGTMLRLGMSNPPFIKKYIDEICEILLHDNVYEFIHIPVQSFSNSVLKKMNREYKVEEFLHLVKTIRTKVPNCMIATDVISGFPTEKPEHHMATRNMLEELKLPVVNISQYYARKGTIACKMKQIPSKVRKGRTRDITNVFMSYETNSKYKGQVIKVYFNQINCHYQLIGHDKHYVKVMLVLQVRHRVITKSNTKKKKSKRRNATNNGITDAITNGITNGIIVGTSNGITNGITNGISSALSQMTVSRSSSGSIDSAGTANSCNCTCKRCTNSTARAANGNTAIDLNGKGDNVNGVTSNGINATKGNNVVTNGSGVISNGINATKGNNVNGTITNGVTSNGINATKGNNVVTNGSGVTSNVNGSNGDSITGTDGSHNDLGISDDSSDGYLSDAMLESTPNIFREGNFSTMDSRHLTDKYFGTVQYVKVVKTTKWHLEGIIV